MFNSIYVPVDNSEYSNRAVDLAVSIGEKFESKKITGCHVYAAAMHDYRFKQMEYTLPEEYLLEDELERQRKIHDSLITMGLELISDSYLDVLGRKCDEVNLPLERKMMDGKHHVEILKDIEQSDYDLVVMGVLGVGKTRDSQIGSVCERVTRDSSSDVYVVKHVPRKDEPERDTILVGVDGSPQSFGAMITAIELAYKFNKKVELISVYDPYLHYAVFNSIVDVLSEKAAKVFRFEEQNQLHEEVIDTGLAQIYQSHLNVAETMAVARGVEVRKTLLDGKAFQKVLGYAREIKPWLMVIGRIGVHSDKDEAGLGSNAENLLRMAPCDVLLTTRLEEAEIDLRADESILWTSEAEDRMLRVPQAVRGVARRGVLRLAIEQGHSVVTNAVIQDAMDRFMPKQTADATLKLAEQLVIERAKQGNISMCKKCGTTAREANAVQCSVCGSRDFDLITADIIEKIVSEEGGAEEETTYDGRKLRWTRDARKHLLAIEDPYQKRRAKARIEKSARMKKITSITSEFAKAVIDDEVGKVLFKEDGDKKLAVSTYDPESDKTLITVDDKGWELRSVFAWEPEAASRMLQVPAGFMRERTLERVENLALDNRMDTINMTLVEEALDLSKNAMLDLMVDEGLISQEEINQIQAGPTEDGKCPFSSYFKGEKLDEVATKTELAAQKVKLVRKDNNGSSSKQSQETNGEKQCPVSNVFGGAVDQVLNESGLMSEMKRARDRLVKN